MPHNLPGSWMPSHSNELERRLTTVEVTQLERQTTNDGRWIAIETRLSYLEKVVQGLIYAIGALAASKSGDIVETAAQVLKTIK